MRYKTNLRPGDKLTVGNVTIKMVKKSGQIASLVIEAGKEVVIAGPHRSDDKQVSVATVGP